eukprot:6187901-Pleurochrysis_carterae.AAC.3
MKGHESILLLDLNSEEPGSAEVGTAWTVPFAEPEWKYRASLTGEQADNDNKLQHDKTDSAQLEGGAVGDTSTVHRYGRGATSATSRCASARCVL